MLAYVDSSVWIARIEGHHSYKHAIETSLDQLKQNGWSFCISQAVIMETLYKPYRENNQELVSIYMEMFKKSKHLPIYAKLFEDAIRIVQIEHLKAMDSIHVALASQYGCKRFITTDTDFRNLQTLPIFWIDLSLKF